MPVVFVHSAVTDAREWDGVRAELDGVARDLPGFGTEPLPPQELSLAETVLAWFDGRATLVGTSFGGRAVLEAALAAPERVERIVLVGANPFEWSDDVRAIGEEEDAFVEGGRFDDAAALMVRWWLVGPRREPADIPADLRERVHEMARRGFELQHGVDASVLRVDLDLSKITAPVLVVRGELDWPDVERAAERFVRELPDARELVIDGVAHLPAMERPDEVARLVGEFLRNQRDRT
jgi:Predicted hydrolases or acyltransferases (alpha/beta hydrolase superfamily)